MQSRLSPSTCPLSRSWGQVFTKLSHVAPGLPWIFPLEPSFRLKWQMPNRGSVTPEPVIGALAGLSLGAPKVTAHLHQGMCCSGWGCSPRRLQVCSSQMATHRAPLAAAKPLSELPDVGSGRAQLQTWVPILTTTSCHPSLESRVLNERLGGGARIITQHFKAPRRSCPWKKVSWPGSPLSTPPQPSSSHCVSAPDQPSILQPRGLTSRLSICATPGSVTPDKAIPSLGLNFSICLKQFPTKYLT